MCGIAGIWAGHSARAFEESVSVVREMMSSLAHRGPDGEGLWIDPQRRCVLGHRRLSVIDPSDPGAQPMQSADGRWVIVQNGEIYNFREFASRLAAKGLAQRGCSDTEVFVNAIALWHTRVFAEVDGMFAVAAFDTATGELLLGRDPFGEKPLYYIELPGGALAFASELHALEQLPGLALALEFDAIAELMMFQYIGAPRTIYRSVRKLPPGHYLRISPGTRASITRYFSFWTGEAEFESRRLGDFADELEALLLSSLERRLVADVPIGAFLSGGVDSSTACALVRQKLGVRLKTFSLGFANTHETEHAAAQAYAAHLGLDHTHRVLDEPATRLLLDLGGLLDEPNADWSCLPVYLLSELARGEVTVTISGDGGDEMFAGYDWYFGPLGHASRSGGRDWVADESYTSALLMTGESVIQRLFGAVPEHLTERLKRMRSDINQPSPGLALRLRRNEAENYLPGAVLAKVDRMSMRHALEVRTPYLSPDVARFASRLPLSALYLEGKGKAVLREVAYRYLPRELVDRPKMGFGIPGRGWAAREIREVAVALLRSDDTRLRVCFGQEVLDQYLDDETDLHRLWTLAMVESWCRRHRPRLPGHDEAIAIESLT
jgi:asparagine synthase (glutamine-hydrolysing)